MRITKQYLLDNRTKGKAWTKAQMDVLAMPWPPRKGWMNLVVGRELTDREAELFESGKSVTSASNLKRIKGLIRKLDHDEKRHLITWLSKT